MRQIALLLPCHKNIIIPLAYLAALVLVCTHLYLIQFTGYCLYLLCPQIVQKYEIILINSNSQLEKNVHLCFDSAKGKKNVLFFFQDRVYTCCL